MRKNSKLRCLFFLTRNRASSPPPDDKLTPTNLKKCPVKPNQYTGGGIEQTEVMGSNLKSGRIDPDKNPAEIIPLNWQAGHMVVAQVNSTPNDEVPNGRIVRHENTINSVEQKNRSPPLSHQVNAVKDSANGGNHPPNPSTTTTLRERSDFSHSYEKLIPPKRHPTKEESIFRRDPTTSSSSSSPKVYKKQEFARPVTKILYQNAGNDPYEVPFSNPATNSHFSFSPDSGASNVFHSPISSSDLTLNTNGACHCDHCDVERETVKDCNFGWCVDASRKSESCLNRLGQSNHCHCPDHSRNTPQVRYTNDNQDTFMTEHDPATEVAFTVTEKNGKSLKFTIVEPGIPVELLLNNTDDVTNRMTSSVRKRYQDMMRGQEARRRSSPGLGHRFDRNRNGLFNTMTPSLTSAETMQALRPETGKCPKHEDVVTDVGKMVPQRKPHFELSMASYSRLIAYCGNNKLNPGSQTISRHHTQPTNNPQQINNAITSNGQSDLCRLAKVLETVEECPWYWGPLSGQEAKKVLRDAEPGTFLLRDSSDPRHLFSLSVKTRQGPTSIRIVYTDGTFRFDSELDDAASRRRNAQNADPTRVDRDHPNYVKKITPIFTCVIKMVLFYTQHLGLNNPKPRTQASTKRDQCPKCSAHLSSSKSDGNSPNNNNNAIESYRPEQFMCYWVNRNGRQEIPVLLSTPKTKKQCFPSLQSLCRQTLNVSQKLWVRPHVVDQLPLPNPLKKYIKRYPYPV